MRPRKPACTVETVTGSDRAFRIVSLRQVDVFTAVREELTQLIEHGGYEPGDRLPSERVLAERLQVSRNMIREAIKVLQATGKVEIVHGSGTFVRSPVHDPLIEALRLGRDLDETFLLHLIDVRIGLEVEVIRLAISRADEVDIAAVGEALERLEVEHLPDPEVGSLNPSFEAALGKTTHNPLLMRLQAAVHELWIEAWSGLRVAPGTKHGLHEEHVAMYDTLVRRDAELATSMMRWHIERFRSLQPYALQDLAPKDTST